MYQWLQYLLHIICLQEKNTYIRYSVFVNDVLIKKYEMSKYLSISLMTYVICHWGNHRMAYRSLMQPLDGP